MEAPPSRNTHTHTLYCDWTSSNEALFTFINNIMWSICRPYQLQNKLPGQAFQKKRNQETRLTFQILFSSSKIQLYQQKAITKKLMQNKQGYYTWESAIQLQNK